MQAWLRAGTLVTNAGSPSIDRAVRGCLSYAAADLGRGLASVSAYRSVVAVLEEVVSGQLVRSVIGVVAGRVAGAVVLYNHLRDPDKSPERYLRLLVTIPQLVDGIESALLGVRRDMAVPEASADVAMFENWAGIWRAAGPWRVASAGHLDDYAERKGWRWNTQEVTFGMLPPSAEAASEAASGPLWAIVPRFGADFPEPQPADVVQVTASGPSVPGAPAFGIRAHSRAGALTFVGVIVNTGAGSTAVQTSTSLWAEVESMLGPIGPAPH